MKRLLTLIFACLLPLLSGCLTQADQGAEANKLVTAVHQSFQDGDWDRLLPLYDEQFIKTHPTEKWKQQLTSLTQPMGKLINIKPTFEQHDPRFGGDFYLYGFILQFEKGSISETITIYKAVNAEKMTISGHELRVKRQAS